jgi:hypothetical protein
MSSKVGFLICSILAFLSGCVSSPTISVSGTFKSVSGKLVQITPKYELLVERSHEHGRFFVGVGHVWKVGTSETSLAVMTRSSGPREWMGAEIQFDDRFSSFEVIPYDERFNGVRKPSAKFKRVF